MKVQREETIAAMASLRVEKDRLVCDYDELVAKTEQDNLRCEQEMKLLHEDVRSLTNDQNRSTSEIECLTKELLVVESKLTRCDSENKTLMCEVGDVKETCVKLEADVECETGEKNEITRTLREKEEIVRTLMTTIEGLKQNEDITQKEKQVMWHEIKRLRLGLETAKSTEETQICDLQKTLTNVRSQNEQELQSERQIAVYLRKQHKLDLKTEMKSVLETLLKFMDKPDDWCESITVDTVGLKAQLELAFNEKAATIHGLREESSRAGAKLEAQIAECGRKTEQCAKLEVVVAELTSEVDDCRKRVTVAHEQLDMAAAELSQERIDADTKMNDSLHETKSLYDSRISDATAELELARSAVVAMETELREGRETFKQQLSALKFQHSSEQMMHQSTLKDYTAKQDEVSSMMSRIAEQQGHEDMLELELRDLHLERNEVNLRHDNEMREMTDALEQWKLQAEQQTDTVSKMRAELEEKLGLVSKLEEQLEMREEDLTALRGEYEQQMEELTSDNTQLKTKLIELLKQKDAMWQKLDQFEYEQQQRSTDTWMDSAGVDHCLGCRAEFSFFVRKHHCRVCGRIYCDNCSAHWVMTPHSGKKERVCDGCFLNMSQSEATLGGATSPNDSGDSSTEQRTETQSLHAETRSEQLPGDSLADDDNTEQGGSTLDSTAATQEGSIVDSTPETRLKESPAAIESTQSEASIATVTTDGDPSLYCSRGAEALTEGDDVFDVITDREVTVSQLEGICDATTVSAPVVMAAQVSGVLESEGDLRISAGRIYAVPVFIASPGITLCWEFTTKPKGIHFRVTFTGEEAGSERETEELIPLCKVNSHKKPICGELTVRKAGLYTITFDNSNSRMTAKKLEYRLEVRKGNDNDDCSS